MRHVELRHIGSNSTTHRLAGRLIFFFLVSIASCDGGDGLVRTGNDASLSYLSISGVTLEPAFTPSVTDYTAAARFPAKITQVTPTARDPDAAISVNGNSVASGVVGDLIALDEGGNTISVSVTAKDNSTTQTYTIEVARQSASEFTERAYLKAINRDAEDWSGFSLSLSENADMLALGDGLESSSATGINGDETDTSAFDSGAAYVFKRDGTGTWTQQAYFKASNTDQSDGFGMAVAMSADGSTLAAGAPFEASAATGVNGDETDNSFGGAGAVYIFTRDGGGAWAQQAYIKASNTGEYDEFGRSVSLSDDGATLAVGALGEGSAATGVNGDETDDSAQHSGAAYVYTRHSGGVWTQQAYLKASNTDVEDTFGWFVALSGDGTTLAVGAIGEDGAATGVNGIETDNSAYRSGAVYVFARDIGGNWLQEAYIKASNTGPYDNFGSSIEMSDDGATLAVSAGGESSAATGVNGEETDNSMQDAGAVYIFTRESGGAWNQQAYVKASNTDEWDLFGHCIALSADGSMLVAGAIQEDGAAAGVNGDDTDNTAYQAGAVYVFTRDSSDAWTQRAYIKPSDVRPLLFFGHGVAVSGEGTTLVVDALEDPGALYFFEL